MFDVILVSHYNIMTISGTHIQGLHSTQIRHHTPIHVLTCCACFVKHMMITTQVRHHTLLDLTTWRACSVKHIILMRQHLSRLWFKPYLLHAHGLGLSLFLVRWSVICCQDGGLMAFAKGASPEEYLIHNFDEQYLGGHWAYLTPFLLVGGHHWSLGTMFLGS